MANFSLRLSFFAVFLVISDAAFSSSSSSSSQDDALGTRVFERLKMGDGGEGKFELDLKGAEVAVGDGVVLRIGETSVSGLRLLDVAEAKTTPTKLTANLKFSKIVLTSSAEVLRPTADAVLTTGQVIVRLLDVDLLLDAAVVAAPQESEEVRKPTLEEVDAQLRPASVAIDFDEFRAAPLAARDPAVATLSRWEMAEHRDGIVDLLVDALKKKIEDVVREAFDANENHLPWQLPADVGVHVQRANRFVDKLLKDNRETLKGTLGLVKLPDEYFEFSKKIVFVETHGFARLTHGHLDNLHAIARKGDCAVYVNDNVLNIAVDLGVDDVLGGYFIEVKFGVFGANSNLKVKVKSIQLVIKGLHSFRETSRGDEDDNILNFDLALNVKANLGYIDVDVNIFGPLDWLFNLIAEKVVRSLKGRLQGMIKNPIKVAIKGISGNF